MSTDKIISDLKEAAERDVVTAADNNVMRLMQNDDGDYVDCWNCGGSGKSHHDCGEDTCCCLHPIDNVPCDICDGKGGWINE